MPDPTPSIAFSRPPLVVGLSGSLRTDSVNLALLRAAARLAAPELNIRIATWQGELPHFSPDLETQPSDRLPASVQALQTGLRRCAGVLISVPEYAHGVPGSFKNLLDWVVGSGELVGKPVAMLGVSGRGIFVRHQLTEILGAMDARVLGHFEVPLSSNRVSDAELLSTPAFREALQVALDALREAAVPQP